MRQLRAGIPAEEQIFVIPRDTSVTDAKSRRRAAMLDKYRVLRSERSDDLED